MAKATDAQTPALKLIVRDSGSQEHYDLRHETITLGRAHDNSLPLADPRTSRHHCKIEFVENEWFVVDVGSQNGTFLNGRRVRRSKLMVGDVVQLGSTKVSLEPKVETGTYTETVTQATIDVGGDLRLEEDSDPLSADILLRLQGIASALNTEHELERLLNLIIDNAIELTGAERGFLILVGKQEMEFRVARNFEQQEVSAPEFAISWSIATQVSTSGQAVLCVNAADDDRFGAKESVHSLGLRSVMCVPFKVKNRVLGVMYVDNRLHKGVFKRSQFRLLKILADHAAVALENARLYDEVLGKSQRLEDLNRRLHVQVEEQGSRLRAASQGGVLGMDPGDLDTMGRRGAMVGDSAPMRELKALVRKVASSDLPVLITGESGTGKEVVAQAVHRLSRRSHQNLVSENCCAIPESLMESELFGYVKGAFTGANEDRQGLFSAASGGTLFLDEIGDMGLQLQTKLLRVLQEGECRPIGGKSVEKIDVRLITSTNRDLKKQIAQNEFREDLFYRIKVVSIVVPPLRERKDDIPSLIEHFLRLFADEAGQTRNTMTKEALELLKQYRWPGNIRELENELRSMVALGGEVLGKDDVPSHIQEEVELLVGEDSGFHDLNELVESIESREITKALRRTKANKTKAARLLGISRFALQRKMEKYGLEAPSKN